MVTFSALVKPESKSLFAELRQQNNMTVADLFSDMVQSYQKSEPVPLQPDGIDVKMPAEDRKRLALGLLEQCGGDKSLAMAEVKKMIQAQYPGFTAGRNKNRTGKFAEPLRFYCSISDYLGKHLKAVK